MSKSISERIKYKFNFKINTEYSIAKQILEKPEDQIYDNIIINYADGLISGQKANKLLKKIVQLKIKNFPVNGYDLLNLGFKEGRANWKSYARNRKVVDKK